MNASDWRLIALLSLWHGLTFCVAFAVGYVVSVVLHPWLGLLAFGACVYYWPRLDSLLR
ncbi:MAG: hypothetical protein GTO41_11800 [Burkholderiales bacterium]|nr:hypothetical protein [Burkholderiales bacterium]